MKIGEAPNGSGGGNTKSPPKQRINASKCWTFTYFNENGSNFALILDTKKCDYYFGLEICPETKKKHLQGYIEFHSKQRPIEYIGIKEIHWEKARGDRLDNVKYCSKDGKVFTNTNWKIPKPLKDPMEGKEFKWWQKEIIDMINTDCNEGRLIYWYWEKKGGCGKTSLAKHICMKYNAIYVNGKSADVKCGIQLMGEKNLFPDICIFGYPRSKEEYTNYASLEEVKDAIFFSGKYESGMVMYNNPHVIVFANFAPDISTITKERWVIKEID